MILNCILHRIEPQKFFEDFFFFLLFFKCISMRERNSKKVEHWKSRTLKIDMIETRRADWCWIIFNGVHHHHHLSLFFFSLFGRRRRRRIRIWNVKEMKISPKATTPMNEWYSTGCSFRYGFCSMARLDSMCWFVAFVKQT